VLARCDLTFVSRIVAKRREGFPLKMRPTDIHYDAGDVRVDQRWDEITKPPFSAKETLQRVENCGAWFVFKSAQRDPEYRVFLDRGLAEIKAQIGPGIDSQILVEDIIIFVTSPRRVTTYHIDRECNFLLQVQGTKTLHVFDREDREALSEEEIESFWGVDFNAAVLQATTPATGEVLQTRAWHGSPYPGELPPLA
jgi:hypothetical protein